DQQTKMEDGIPANYNLSGDSSDYDTQLSTKYSAAFEQNLNKLANEMGLSANEKAQLQHLFYNPEANVPDRAKLLSLIKNLSAQAREDVIKDFSLLKFHTLKPGTKEYNQILKNHFEGGFEEKVYNFSPPLSKEQREALLSTNGMYPGNLP